MKKLFFFLFIVCNAVCVQAQLQDAAVAKLLAEADFSRLNEDFTNALQLINSAFIISNKKNDYAALAYEYACQSKIFTKNNRIEEARNAINQSLSFAEKSKDDIANAVALSASSYFYKNNDLLDFSIRDAQKGLSFLKTKKDYSLSSSLYFDVYYAYTNWNKLDKVKEYSRLALTDAEKSADIKCKTDAYDAMVNYFDASYAQTKSDNDKDSIFHYADKKAFLCKKYPAEMGYTTYATTCLNLASIYFAYLTYNADVKKKIFYYLSLVEQTVNNHPLKYDYLTNVYGLKGACAEQEGDLTTAEKYYLIAEGKMLTQKVPYYYTWMNDYNALVNLYKKKKDFEKAFIYQRKLQDINEKIHNQQQIKNAQKLEIQYEVEKKNTELTLLKERAESRKMQNYLYLGIICITLLGLGFMFRSYHYKLKYSAQREKKLEAKKQEAELQIKLEKEEKVRLKIEQELLSIKQNQLQKEIMANSLQLSRKNEMLQQIKNKIKEGETNEINKIIKEEMFIDSDFEKTKYQVQQLHPDFFNLLNAKATQKLSQLDMKYCAYLHLKMSTKQIANLLHIEAKSVRVAKYRIKQKLGLNKDDDLDDFLQKVS